MENLTGRYVKVTRKFTSLLNLGDILQITEDDKSDSYVTTTRYGVTIRSRLKDGDLEILPVGFIPGIQIIEIY